MENNLTKEKKGKLAEWVIFGFYVLLIISISCFHEPWYDEAEAWQMAKAPIKDILFYIPHYEGHPALWYLLLSIPAKLGLPYEIGLKTIACASAFVYGWLLLFCSPFPKLIRYSLPFHYFLFYQYGILSRPYGPMVTCFFLMAMSFGKRNEKPWRFILPMAVLCGLSGYGIVLAGGICIAWVWEICEENQWKIFMASFWKDRRILSLTLLLAVAVIFILEIMPRPDTSATNSEAYNSLFVRLIYTIFMMLPDSTIITVLEGAAFLNKATINGGIIFVGVLIGICLLTAIAMFASKRGMRYYFVPYVLFTVFSAFVYFCAHHIGIIFVFTIFWLWAFWKDPDKLWLGKKVNAKLNIAEADAKTLVTAGKLGLGILLIIPLYWTIGASFLDVTQPFYYGRDLANYIKEHKLDGLKIMGGFTVNIPVLYDVNDDIFQYVNTELVARPVAVVPYFEHNFCLNLGMGRDDAAYALHRMPSAEENRNTIRAWQEMGMPDMIIDSEGMFFLMGDEYFEDNYLPIYVYKPYMHIWKAFTCKYNISGRGYVYLKKGLLEKYGVKMLTIEDLY